MTLTIFLFSLVCWQLDAISNQTNKQKKQRKKMKTKIENGNLNKYIGQTVSLYCQVGVVFNLTGKLVADFGFCNFALDLGNGNHIGFSFGEFTVEENGAIHIYIA